MSAGTISLIAYTVAFMALTIPKRTRPYAGFLVIAWIAAQAVGSARQHDYSGLAMFFIVATIIGSDMAGKRKGWVGRFIGRI